MINEFMKANRAIQFLSIKLEIAMLFIVPLGQKLVYPQVNIYIVFVVAFAYWLHEFCTAGHHSFGMHRPYEYGIQVLLVIVAQHNWVAQAELFVVLYAKHENPDVQPLGGLHDVQYPDFVESVVQLV